MKTCKNKRYNGKFRFNSTKFFFLGVSSKKKNTNNSKQRILEEVKINKEDDVLNIHAQTLV